ncbi:MAG: VOC family protein [Gammaproteobacteria bacterium]|nr:VOC family protein [Gammaproteobacteria bacterium]MDD9964194.1 VOC family protein [Gammaproteobacteria bacterium]
MSAVSRVLNISHIHLNCSDLQRSIAYYQLLGFQLDRIISDIPMKVEDLPSLDQIPKYSAPEGVCLCVGMGLGSDPRATTRLELMQWLEPTKAPALATPSDHLGLVRAALSVKNLAGIAQTLKEEGHAVDAIETTDVSPKLSSAFAHAHDPDGAWLTLMEWIKR